MSSLQRTFEAVLGTFCHCNVLLYKSFFSFYQQPRRQSYNLKLPPTTSKLKAVLMIYCCFECHEERRRRGWKEKARLYYGCKKYLCKLELCDITLSVKSGSFLDNTQNSEIVIFIQKYCFHLSYITLSIWKYWKIVKMKSTKNWLSTVLVSA